MIQRKIFCNWQASWIPGVASQLCTKKHYSGSAGGPLNVKKSSYKYKDSHYTDKMVLQLYGHIIFMMGFPIPEKTVFTVKQGPGGRLNKKDGLTRYGNPMLKIRRPNGRLIFNMEIAIHR